MPLYEFRCDTCGVFDAWRTMAESDQPAVCPTCETMGKRIFSPPAILSGSLRLKQERTEPQLVQKSVSQEPVTPKYKSHTGGRPWMVSH